MSPEEDYTQASRIYRFFPKVTDLINFASIYIYS